MRRRRANVGSVNEEIKVILKSMEEGIFKTESWRTVSGDITPAEKFKVIEFFYNLYTQNKRHIGPSYKEEFYEVVESIMNEKIPIDVLSFGDIKDVLFKHFPFLDRNR